MGREATHCSSPLVAWGDLQYQNAVPGLEGGAEKGCAPDALEIRIGNVPFSEHSQAPAGRHCRLIQLEATQHSAALLTHLLLHVNKAIFWLHPRRRSQHPPTKKENSFCIYL